MNIMKPNSNPKLRIFVDSLLARLQPHSVRLCRNFVVNHYAINDTYAFSFEEDPTSPYATPSRVVQASWDDSVPEQPIKLIFLNERGPYTEGIPHSMPMARCAGVQSMNVAVCVTTYLSTGQFAPVLKYGLTERKGAAPVIRPLSEEQVKANRDALRQSRAKPAPKALGIGERIILAVTKYRLYHLWNPIESEKFPEVNIDDYLGDMNMCGVPRFESQLTQNHVNTIRNATTVDPARAIIPESLRSDLRKKTKVLHMQLPSRVKHILLSNDLYVAGQLTCRTVAEMKKLRGLGKLSLQQIQSELTRLNLAFRS